MKKEYYKHILPHYQLPGQAYFVTWILQDAVPQKALQRYTQKLEELKNLRELYKKQKSDKHTQDKITQQILSVRRKYIKAFEDLIHVANCSDVDLSKFGNREIVKESLIFWEGKKLINFAFCIMPNHVHWVFQLKEKDEFGRLVYLEDIMHSVKRYSANQINKLENRQGKLWQKESFDTTIRNEKHLYNTMEYTWNNPVAAGLVKKREDWPGLGFGCGGFYLP